MKLFLILITIFTWHLAVQARGFNVAAVGGAHVNLGTQFNGLHFQFGLITSYSIDNNLGGDIAATLDYQLYWRKFGVKSKASSLVYELKSTIGRGDAGDLLGLANGIMANHAYIPKSQLRSFHGVGFGWNKTKHFGKLNRFNSSRGSFLLRFSNKTDHFLVNFNNDLRAGPLRGKATDFGETGSLTMKYIQSSTVELHTVGGTIELFTPEPDYSKNPEAKGNSDFESKIVTSPKGSFPNLYHGNLFVFYNYQNANTFGEVGLGVDSKKSGAFIQNLLHDYFALYPRFEWPIQKPAKPYLQIKGGVQTSTIVE